MGGISDLALCNTGFAAQNLCKWDGSGVGGMLGFSVIYAPSVTETLRGRPTLPPFGPFQSSVAPNPPLSGSILPWNHRHLWRTLRAQGVRGGCLLPSFPYIKLCLESAFPRMFRLHLNQMIALEGLTVLQLRDRDASPSSLQSVPMVPWQVAI